MYSNPWNMENKNMGLYKKKSQQDQLAAGDSIKDNYIVPCTCMKHILLD